MPFKSRAQLRKFAVLVEQGKMKPRVFKEWLKATPSVKKLPERVKTSQPSLRPNMPFSLIMMLKR